jgi:virginiamycin B lyase
MARIRRNTIWVTVGLALAFFCGVGRAASAAPVEAQFLESKVALPGVLLNSIATDANGSTWFSGEQRLRIVAPGGQPSEVRTPRPALTRDLLSAPQGILWAAGHAIDGITPGGESFEYRLKNRHARVGAIAAGREGELWYEVSRRDARGQVQAEIDRRPPSGKISRVRLPRRSGVGGMAVGPDGSLWISEDGPGPPKIGHVATTGQVTEFPLPRQNRIPGSIAVGPDGNLWFGESYAHLPKASTAWIGKITPAGVIEEFAIPGATVTAEVTAGPDGDVWFVTREALASTQPEAIDSITPGGEPAQPSCVDAKCELVPADIAVGLGGALWVVATPNIAGPGGGGTGIVRMEFAREAGSVIGKFAPPPQTIAVEAPG